MDQGNGVAELYNNQSVTEGLWHNITAVLRPDRYSYSRTANRIQSFCISRCEDSFFILHLICTKNHFPGPSRLGGGGVQGVQYIVQCTFSGLLPEPRR
jgi:hypothetical protein